ncbi:MAG: AAA family ATPase [Christensenellaceae bacterium]
MSTKKIVIENVRNIGQMSFEVPPPGLHVLTGQNGAGKTTLFTCISRIGDRNAFRKGFPSAQADTLDELGGTICYEVHGNRVVYSKRANGEWRPDKNTSVLQDFGYPQVVNITTKNARIFSQESIIPRKRNTPDDWLNEKLNSIFDTTRFTDMMNFTIGDLRGGQRKITENRRRNIAYAIPLTNNRYYTEQNFSFGEIVLINLLYDVKNAMNGSLLLIDELELALHPSAQVRLISCLRELTSEKGLTILISTHSASIIKAEKSVIFLEQESDGITIPITCPPAKAIGAIGMREDTNPDIIVLVEDKMGRAFFYALKQKYIELQAEASYLDIRELEIGGFPNVVHFYTEANNYVFYNNVYLAAFLDKDVETDIVPYARFGNQKTIELYDANSAYIHFLPYTPEVFLIKTLYNYKRDLLSELKQIYNNHQLRYSTPENFEFENYEVELPVFQNQDNYNACIKRRGLFRTKCKTESERISSALADQINQSVDEVYRAIFKFAVERESEDGMNVRAMLASTMKRLR